MDSDLREAERRHRENPEDGIFEYQYRLTLVRSGMPEVAGLRLGDYVRIDKGMECLGPIYSMIWHGIIVKEYKDGLNKGNFTISPLVEDKDFIWPNQTRDVDGAARMYRDEGIFVWTTSDSFPSRITLVKPVHPGDRHHYDWRVWKAIRQLKSWHQTEKSWGEMVPHGRGPYYTGATNINFMSPEARATARTYKDIHGPWCPWRPGHFGYMPRREPPHEVLYYSLA